MILPDKHLAQERSLLFVGAEILAVLDGPRSPAEIWEEMSDYRKRAKVSFDWFAKALAVLFAVGAISMEAGIISAKDVP